VRDSQVHHIAELQHRDIYAFSYFYDRGLQVRCALVRRRLQAALVAESSGGYVTPLMYYEAAATACDQSWADIEEKGEHWRIWQCLDLTYIHALLTSGYRLDQDTEIFVKYTKYIVYNAPTAGQEAAR